MDDAADAILGRWTDPDEDQASEDALEATEEDNIVDETDDTSSENEVDEDDTTEEVETDPDEEETEEPVESGPLPVPLELLVHPIQQLLLARRDLVSFKKEFWVMM